MKLRLIPIAAVAALMLAGCDKSSTDVSKAVDEARGLVVTSSFADFGFGQTGYTLTDGRSVETSERHPMARELFEVYRIQGGRIASIDAVSVAQPYRMASPFEQ